MHWATRLDSHFVCGRLACRRRYVGCDGADRAGAIGVILESGAQALLELSPIFGDGLIDQAATVAGSRLAGLAATSSPSANFTPRNQFWQLVVAVEASPSFLRGFDKLEDHGERGAVRQAALRPDRAVARGCERAFDGVRVRKCFQCSAGEVVESQ